MKRVEFRPVVDGGECWPVTVNADWNRWLMLAAGQRRCRCEYTVYIGIRPLRIPPCSHSGMALRRWERRQRTTGVQADASTRARAANSRTGPGWVAESCSDCQTTSECFFRFRRKPAPLLLARLMDSFAFSITFIAPCLISPFPSSPSDEYETTKCEICCK